MRNILLCAALAATAAFAQYKTEPAGPAPSELAPALRDALAKDGIKVLADAGAVACELWLRASAPSGTPSTEENVSLPSIPQGALLGVIRFSANGLDRRGFTIKAGIYTLRYSLYPVNGDHQGVAPQRDFLVLVRAADDPGSTVNPPFDKLMDLARRASGTPHPLTLSLSKDSPGDTPRIAKQGDNDWVLHAKIGDLPVAVIVAGQYAG